MWSVLSTAYIDFDRVSLPRSLRVSVKNANSAPAAKQCSSFLSACWNIRGDLLLWCFQKGKLVTLAAAICKHWLNTFDIDIILCLLVMSWWNPGTKVKTQYEKMFAIMVIFNLNVYPKMTRYETLWLIAVVMNRHYAACCICFFIVTFYFPSPAGITETNVPTLLWKHLKHFSNDFNTLQSHAASLEMWCRSDYRLNLDLSRLLP